MPLATLEAIFPPDNAPPAKLDACPNLSHLENARAFVTVKLSAITIFHRQSLSHHKTVLHNPELSHTDKRQPDKLESEDSNHCQTNP